MATQVESSILLTLRYIWITNLKAHLNSNSFFFKYCKIWQLVLCQSLDNCSKDASKINIIEKISPIKRIDMNEIIPGNLLYNQCKRHLLSSHHSCSDSNLRHLLWHCIHRNLHDRDSYMLKIQTSYTKYKPKTNFKIFPAIKSFTISMCFTRTTILLTNHQTEQSILFFLLINTVEPCLSEPILQGFLL